MIHLKQVVLAFCLSTTITLGMTGSASASPYTGNVLATITKHALAKPKAHKTSKVVSHSPALPAPAATPTPTPVAQPVAAPVSAPEPVAIPAPVVEPVVQPAPSPAPITGQTDCELARSLIDQYSWPTTVAYNVMVQESHCNPAAVNWNDNHGSCMGSFGLFQISCEQGQLYDPAANVAQAFAMWQARGWQPWSFSTCKIVSCY